MLLARVEAYEIPLGRALSERILISSTAINNKQREKAFAYNGCLRRHYRYVPILMDFRTLMGSDTR